MLHAGDAEDLAMSPVHARGLIDLVPAGRSGCNCGRESNLSADYRSEMIRHTKTLLERWDGADARLLRLTQDHPCLSVLLTREGQPGNLVVSCTDPSHITSPVRFTASGLHVVVDNGSDGVVLLDATGDVRVLAHEVRCSENVQKP